MTQKIKTERGVALMMILWVMALLSVIVAEFAFSMRTELKIARNYKEEVENYYLAQSAVQYGLTEILNPEAEYNYLSGGVLVFGKKEEETEAKTYGEPEKDEIPNRNNIQLGGGFFSYRIEDEEGKIYINKFGDDNEANRAVLKRLLEYGAEIGEGVEQDTIVDSIMDWLDGDDLHKMNGAEDDYYMSQPLPYPCKNGPLDTVEELLMVKGITPEILFGTEGDGEKGTFGIAKFITVWGNGRFNRDTADDMAIAIVYGEELEEETKTPQAPQSFEGAPDNTGAPQGAQAQQMQKSNYFSIIGRGYITPGGGQRLVKAVVNLSAKNGAPSARILHWNDNVLDYTWPTEPSELETPER